MTRVAASSPAWLTRMSAALARCSAAGRGSGAGSEPPGTGRDVLAGAKTERSPRSRAAMAESRRRPDSISKSSIIEGNYSGQTLSRGSQGPREGLSGAFALVHLLEYTSPPFFGPGRAHRHE